MDRIGSLISLTASGFGRISLAYYFLSLSSTPLLLSIVLSACLVIFGIFQLWMCSPNSTSEPSKYSSFGLAAYNAMEIILMIFSIQNNNLLTLVMLKLLILFTANVISASDKKYSLQWVSSLILVIIATSLLLAANLKLNGLGFVSAIAWSLVTIDLHKFSSQKRNPIPIKSLIHAEALGSAISLFLCASIWINNVERKFLLDVNLEEISPLLLLGLATSTMYAAYNRFRWAKALQDPISHSTIIIFVSITIAVIHGIFHNDEISWALIAATGLYSTAAYLATPVRSDKKEILKADRDESSTMSFIRLSALIGITFLLMSVQSSQTLNAQILSKYSIQPDDDILLFDFNEHNITGHNNNILGINQLYDLSDAEIERKEQRHQCLTKARKMIIDRILPLIPSNKNFTVTDVPYHWNIGDQLIWYGEERLWHVYGQLPLRTDDFQQRNLTLLKNLEGLGDGPIFIHGGGNFGDLYQYYGEYKVSLTKEFPNNSIISLPQSLKYVSKKNTVKHQAVFSAHKNVTFLWRDFESMDFARLNFPNSTSIYVPDMAFMMGPLIPNSLPSVDVIMLIRRDSEKATKDLPLKAAKKKIEDAGHSVEVWEFPVSGFPNVTWAKTGEVVYDYRKFMPDRLVTPPYKEENIDVAIELRVQVGFTLFSRGRLIIADRLHASIMATLLDKPLIYVDNSYRKLTRVRGALAKTIPECSDKNLNAQHVKNIDEAATKALELLAKMKSPE